MIRSLSRLLAVLLCQVYDDDTELFVPLSFSYAGY